MRPGFAAVIRRTSGLSAVATSTTIGFGASAATGSGSAARAITTSRGQWPVTERLAAGVTLAVLLVAGQHDAHPALVDHDPRQDRRHVGDLRGGGQRVTRAREPRH